MGFKIGDIEFRDKAVFLAPMEDVTDASFRYICKEFGADMMYTEFVSSDGLVHNAQKSFDKMQVYDYERPIGIQIYGHIPEAMVEAAKFAQQYKPDLIDINFGCPVNKIAKRGAGSGMMRFPELMVEITRKVVEAVDLPVTVKTRLGWDENSLIIPTLAEQLQDVGIKALTIHGRTRCQMYKGVADWTLIGEVKRNPRIKIPIIGNGDIVDGPSAKRAFDDYGVDVIMVGRATYGRPWVFKEIKYFLEKGEEMPPLTVLEKVELAKKHYAKSIEVKGDRRGMFEMRRHLSNYFKALPDFKETRMKLVTETDPVKVVETLDYIAQRWG